MITHNIDFESYVDEQIKRIEKVLLNILSRAGEEAVNEARQNGSYMDQTGNLRSSIGYIVVKDKKAVEIGDFNTVKKGGEGSRSGKDFALSLVGTIDGYGLIVVAGMNYAKYVETKRNVLTSAKLKTERLVPQLLKDIGL